MNAHTMAPLCFFDCILEGVLSCYSGMSGGICKRTLGIEFERDRSIGFGLRLSDNHTNSNRDFSKISFSVFGSDIKSKSVKNSKSNFWTTILSSVHSVARKLKINFKVGQRKANAQFT